MRRKKKLIINILKVLAVVLIILFIYFKFFKTEKKHDTPDLDKPKEKTVELTVVNEVKSEIKLPENIYSVDNTVVSDNKTFEPLQGATKTYLITTLANNELTILIGNDSEELIDENTPVQIGKEYTVNGIQSNLVIHEYFNVNNYAYPVLILVDEEGIVYYVDVEEGYKTGTFTVAGTISNLPKIKRIDQTTITEDGETYNSAIFVDENDQGYEFDLSMIGK